MHLRQPRAGFRSGLDAVFLAAACPAQARDHVLEAGCGAGAASLCLLARVAGAKVTGVEIDPGLTALAVENAAANDMTERFEGVAADVTAPRAALDAAGLRSDAYDHVMANPPFFSHGRSRPAKDQGNARARAMPEGELEAWLRFLAASAKPSGTCTVIHTAEALPELLSAFDRRFGDLRITPLYPKANAPAIRVIICGIKGSRAPVAITPGIVLHEQDGTPTAAAEAILRDGCALFNTPHGK
ncbi:MAG TPA: methyltransferase [Geobacterales bacterium]|nr:methyltransferase [Geobacterales bacterium]